ncbi:non-ribosomal peptide synthetase [Massilia sp. CFBP 13647]|uniref:non-ribosomal peptide synthetase n=1 Tax=Massilia sp. CFBP 13647 TaxID=2775276 RepID=UPI001780FA1F|nr:non-ribosomal peptide synthetase [Massilia sp. CFBP 13647]MBD8529926.1 amino acid adenylation domain-containing protein [Massilia sp. CFBP 13647]
MIHFDGGPLVPAPGSAKDLLKARLRKHQASARSAAEAIVPLAGPATRLSFSQQRLWLLDQIMGAHHAYNMSLAVRLHGALDVACLGQSLDAILARHAVLRTRFANRDGSPVPVLDPPTPLAPAPENVAGEQEVQAIWEAERRHVFRLAEERLIRVRLLREGPEQHVLVVTMHHIVSDAWSLGVFFNELIAAYCAASEGRAPELAPLPIQYADYAHWQQESLGRDVLARQADYWRNQLRGLPPEIALPFDAPRPPQQSFRGGLAYLEVPRALTERIRLLGLRSDSTLFMCLFAAFSVLLARRCGEEDIPIGTPVANRTRRETEGLIGFFVNILVLRCDLGQDPTFDEVLRRTRDTVLEAYARQDIPFEYLVETIEPERDLNKSPLFQVMFALQNAPVESTQSGALQLSALVPASQQAVARYDLTFNLTETAGGILGVMEYSSDLFERDTIDNLLAQYLLLLEQIVEQPELPIQEYALVTPWDRLPYRAAQRSGSKAGTHASFLDFVAAQPQRTIVVRDRHGEHDFASILRRADALASLLACDDGTGPQCIGVIEHPGADLLVAVLAIHKIGATVYFIAPTRSALRRRHLLASAGVSLVIDASDPSAFAWLPGGPRIRYAAPLSPPPALRFHMVHGSGKLLEAELDEPAFLDCLLRMAECQSAVHSAAAALAWWFSPVLASMAGAFGKGQVWDWQASLQGPQYDGKLCPGLPMAVLDGAALAPLGTAGELCLANVRLAGVAAAFHAEHPLAQGERLVRTGVRAVMEKDGSCRIAPPTARQRRRARVAAFLAAASEALLRAAAPSQQPTMVAAGGQWTVFVRGGADAAGATLGELLARLKQDPAPQLLPARLRVLDQLPALADGEVDRRALALRGDTVVPDSAPPQGRTEALLAALWEALIPGRRVGRDDNFFLVGGYSLIGAQLVARIRDAFGVELSLRDVFEQQTLQAQARFIDNRIDGRIDGSAAAPAPLAADAAASAVGAPLAFSQQRLWFLSRMMAPNAVYTIPLALRLRGSVDEDALVRSLDAIVDRHAILRTRFAEIDGQAVQLADPPGGGWVVVEDIASEAQLRARHLAERGYCYDLAGEPLTRLRLLRTAFDGQLVLLASFHHIVFDGWSMGVFFRELAQFYGAATGAAECAPPAPLPIQFADYARWQRRHLDGELMAGQLAYWERQLAGLPPLLGLPTDRPRPAEQSFRGATINFVVGAELVARLQELNRSCGSTLFMCLGAAFALLLGRYARQHDVAIGTPVANRQRSETEAMIGFFLNNLVLRFDLSAEGGASTFRTLLGATRAMALQAYANQDVPFEHLVERLNPVRSLAYAPLFQASISLVDTPVQAAAFPGIALEPLQFAQCEGEAGVARYDLSLILSSLGDGGLLGSMEYSSDLFDAATIERMLGHFQGLLAAVARQPDLALAELDFLGRDERRLQLDGWNATARAFPDASVHALFAARAAARPDAVALVAGGAHLSYGALERRANRVAQRLLALGVAPDSCVGLCVERSFDMVVGMLAILKAGAAYVPLDPAYPEPRLRQMVGAAACGVILSQRHLIGELAFLDGCRTLALDGADDGADDAAAGAHDSATAPALAVTPDRLAYVIFTSGSTGVPKGVPVSHANIVSLVASGDAVTVGADAVVAQAASCAFDAITYELWSPLLAGARVLLVDKETLLAPEALAHCLRAQQVTSLFITTALFNRISHEIPQAFAALDQLLFGGEACSPDAIARVLEHGAPRQLLHVYGPTECTTFATGFALERARFLAGRQAPIGMPLANTRAYVLQDGQLAPLGAVGELHLGGAGLARGYLGDPRLSAQKFVPDPFSPTPGARMYRTGDLVRLRADGAIDFIGRADHQVKIRGFRIELGEVEEALRLHADVGEVLVLAREERPGERSLVAYVTPQGGAPAAAELVRHLRGRIPEYAVPGAFVMLDSFPLNNNGKIDRARLPQPDAAAYARAQYTAPASALETRLAALWQANLGSTTPVGTGDNYFAIGGDSIRSIALVSAARAEQLQFSIKDLFAHPTVAELARVVVEGGAPPETPFVAPFALLSAEERAALPARHKGHAVVDGYPLSMLQQGMLFHSMQHPDSPVYHCVITFAVEAAWQPACFEQALRHVIARHPVLRTEFFLHGGRPLQFVSAGRTPALQVHDLRGEPALSAEAAIEAWVLAEKVRGLRIEDPWRIGVLVLDERHLQFGLSFHHALWDGWSDAALVAELFAAYRALLQGQAPQAEAAPPPYSAYMALELAALADDTHRQYWARALEGARQPWWGASPQRQCRHFFCEIDAATSAAVIAVAERLGVQEKSAWCTVYLALTALLDGHDRILGSVVTHGRPEIAGADKTVGLFLNSLPLQVDTGAASWNALIVEVNTLLAQHQAHRHYPLAQIQADLRLDCSASLFNFTNFHVISNAGADSGVIGSGSLGLDQTNYKFSVDVQKNDASNRHVLRVALDPTVFDAAFQQRIGQFVRNILAAMTADPAAPLERARLLGDELARIAAFGHGADSAPPAPSVHAMFEAQARATPDVVALAFEGAQLSYAELDHRANQLAACLRARGVGTDQLVAVCVERSLEMTIGLLGILKAGAAYVPLDPTNPRARLAQMLADSGARIVLTQERFAPALAGLGVEALVLDAGWDAIAAQAAATTAVPAVQAPAGLMYVIYTSGSTGKPKGAMNEQRAIVNRLRWMQHKLPLAPHDRLLQKTPYSFDVSVWELFWALTCGATLVLARPEGHKDPAYLRALIEAASIDALHFVPSMLQVFLDHGVEGGCASLRTIVCSGEMLPAEVAARCMAALPRATLNNMYGPTETAIEVSHWTCRGGEPSVPIGRPLSNTRLYVLDGRMRPVPVGVAGEIYIGGTPVGRGYFGQPALTAQRFVPDALSAVPGARMYATGDLGCWREDGSIACLGRNDQQVKIRGFRIELGDIEAQLAKHPAVGAASVMARTDEGGAARLVAYVTAADAPGTAAPDAAQLRAHLQAALPEYMVPAAFVLLDAFPLTPNGKLDRKALPAPGFDAGAGPGAGQAPQGEMEIMLAGWWQELLRTGPVGRHDDFFALGGHSLLALQLITRVRRGLGRELALRTLFEHPTIHALARQLTRAGGAVQEAIPARAPDAAALPLSFAQQRLWFLCQLDGASAAYHMSLPLRIRGAIDHRAFQGALDALVARHESLRTVFTESGGAPVQVVVPAAPCALRSDDLRALAPDEREAALRRYCAQEAQAPFDLAAGPLLRARLLRVDEDEHVFMLVIHHIVSDGWSIGLLLREFGALYQALRAGQASPLAPLPVQYADYALWQRAWLQGEVLQRQVDFWKAQLDGIPALLELPADHARPPVQSYRGGSVGFALTAELSARLRAFARRHDATLFMTLFAGLAILLYRLGGQRQFAIGTPVANRNRAELEGLIGFFVNTLALPARLDEGMSVAALLRQVKETTLSAYAHQDLPFEKLVEALRPERSLGSSPVFQVMLTLDNTPQGAGGLPGLELSAEGMAGDTEQFDLSLSLQEAGEQIAGAMGYASDLFERATIERWVAHFIQVLDTMVGDEAPALDAISLLDEAQRACVTQGFNGGFDAAPATHASLHGWFEAVAAQAPDAVALVQEGRQLGYAALDAQARRLAAGLRARGIGPGQLVALYLAPGIELVAAVLGVLKAGAAYLPLDPNSPPERLAWMLDDARPALVLSEAGLADALPAGGPAALTLAQAVAAGAAWCGPAPAAPAPQGLAYVIYTSGSTGKPKGVMVEHRQAVALVGAARRAYALTAGDRVLQFAAPSFDVWVEECFGALCSGAALVLRTDAWLDGGMRFWRHCQDAEVTVLNLPTAFWQQLVIDAGPAAAPTSAPTSAPAVRQVIIGGEKVNPAFVARWFAHGGTLPRLVNAYGPTETTVTAAMCVLEDAGLDAALIGRPLCNSRIHILDAHGAAVPVGVAGEIFIGGTGVSRGYLGRPGLSAARFVPDPFGATPGARLYRSGDLGRFRADGSVEYLGRNDEQVKIRGFRIELGEIEAHLNRHPALREAVVVAREDSPGDKRLVAYLVEDARAGAHAGTDVAQLRAWLGALLPPYMVPAAFVRLDTLPLTVSGKVDRKALAATEAHAHAAQAWPAHAYQRPQGASEHTIATVWAELLQRGQVGRQDNFFELGGHSLLAVVAANRLRQAGIEVGLDAFFRFPTVEAMARSLDADAGPAIGAGSGADGVLAMREGDGAAPLFLVHEITGDIFPLFPLARRIAAGIAVHGLSMDDGARYRTVAQLAAHHVRSIRAVQAHGPYRIAGHSFGGVLAYEIAAQLAAAGEEIGFLGLVDSYRPDRDDWGGAVGTLQTLMLYVRIQHPAIDGAVLERLAASGDAEQALALCQDMALFPRELGLDEVKRWAANMNAVMAMAAAYRPAPLAVPAWHFTAADLAPTGERDWTGLLGPGLRTVPVGGTHQGVIQEPQVQVLAAAMSRALEAGPEG